MPSRWIRNEPSVVLFKTNFLWLLKTFVLSVLNIMVDKGSLSSCVVVVIRK